MSEREGVVLEFELADGSGFVWINMSYVLKIVHSGDKGIATIVYVPDVGYVDEVVKFNGPLDD